MLPSVHPRGDGAWTAPEAISRAVRVRAASRRGAAAEGAVRGVPRAPAGPGRGSSFPGGALTAWERAERLSAAAQRQSSCPAARSPSARLCAADGLRSRKKQSGS